MSTSTPAIALSRASLANVDDVVLRPSYDRAALRQAIMHIGVGGFHRAHLATYIDELCQAGNDQWSIVGCGVLPSDKAMAQALGAQDLLYSLVTRGAATTSVQIIGSLTEYIYAADDPTVAIDRIADPDIQIVSLTITEGGYPVDDLTGAYQADSPNAGPGSAFWLIAQGLNKRRQANGAPVTIMSCDNIMTNGNVTKAATLGEAAAFGDELLEWIDRSVSFPNSMVDRITPATADSDRAWLADVHGLEDRWPVVTEPFRQWVIEDDFAGDRLPLEQLDIIVTDDVEPYEFMKLRLLNAGHSCLAYLSALDGYETVDAAMNDADIRAYVRAFLDIEAKPVLPEVAGIDVDKYIETLIERFSNPSIGDQISRLCLDGSAKFPKFLIPTVRAQIAQGNAAPLSALALAGWCRYLQGVADDGKAIQLAPDPLLDTAIDHAKAAVVDPAAFLNFTQVFPEDVRSSALFSEAFTSALEQLQTQGMRATITKALA